MRQLLIACVALAAALPAAAQTTKEEMLASPEKTAGVYYAYPAPESTDHYTKAPKGYTPFYISHFGRHGSRYLISDSEYTNPMETLERADKAGALSPLGKDALKRLHEIYAEAAGRNEDLSPLGVRQHRGVAERMFTATIAIPNAKLPTTGTDVHATAFVGNTPSFLLTSNATSDHALNTIKRIPTAIDTKSNTPFPFDQSTIKITPNTKTEMLRIKSNLFFIHLFFHEDTSLISIIGIFKEISGIFCLPLQIWTDAENIWLSSTPFQETAKKTICRKSLRRGLTVTT